MTIVTPWAVDVKPEFGEELEVERDPVQTDNCWEVDQHFVDRVLRCVILVLVWMLILFIASWWGDDVNIDYTGCFLTGPPLKMSLEWGGAGWDSNIFWNRLITGQHLANSGEAQLKKNTLYQFWF